MISIVSSVIRRTLPKFDSGLCAKKIQQNFGSRERRFGGFGAVEKYLLVCAIFENPVPKVLGSTLGRRRERQSFVNPDTRYAKRTAITLPK